MPSSRREVASARVFRADTLVGTITRSKSGSQFEYDRDFINELTEQERSTGGAAYRLPYHRVRTESRGVNLHPFFAGLLPEGLRLRALLRKTKASEDDLLTLLIASGADCIGDISVFPSQEGPRSTPPLVDVQELNDVVFADLFKQSLAPNGKMDEISIPGVQDKISASMISFPVRRKKGLHSYILKLAPADRPRIIENEFFFLSMARACGLATNPATVVKDQTGTTGLLIERFDRVWDSAHGAMRSIHQEDACQFLDLYPADKYNISLSEIASGILEFASIPIITLGNLIRMVAFSYLIGNGDLHAKNISLRTVNAEIELTPAYDLLSTLPYGDQKMALKLDGRDDNLKRRDFIEFGKRFGVREKPTRSMLDEICDVAPEWISRLEEIGFSPKRTIQLRQFIAKRLKDLG